MTDLVHVLCVDDEPKVLDGLVLNLRRLFRVSTAVNAQAGLAVVDGPDPPAVVVSDMRMPETDGAAFLSQVRERAPDIVRVLLTGHSDLEAAIAAVNHGQIFRFLTKPCTTQAFVAAINAAAEQHRLITAERVLLEQTLRGAIKALIDVLALSNPLAFGRAIRLKHLCAELLGAMGVPMSWQIEVAAMLSQIGCVTLAPETHDKLYHGKPLAPDEAESARRLPALAAELVESIPRLEAVRAILLAERLDFEGPGPAKGAAIPLGARVLRIVSDYDALEAAGSSAEVAARALEARKGKYDPHLVATFIRLKTEASGRAQAGRVLAEVGLADLRPGMVVARGIDSTSGALLVARGQEVTLGLTQRLRNLPNVTVREPIAVFARTRECSQHS